jgi:hypothetical protein
MKYKSKIRLEFEDGCMMYYSEIDAVSITGLVEDTINIKQLSINLNEIANKFEHLTLSNMIDDFETTTTTNNQETINDNSTSKLPIFDKQQLTIINLPKEILFMILLRLDLVTIFKLRATCRTFYDYCNSEFKNLKYFQKLNLQPYWHLVDDTFIETISPMTGRITMLNLSWIKLKNKNPFEK